MLTYSFKGPDTLSFKTLLEVIVLLKNHLPHDIMAFVTVAAATIASIPLDFGGNLHKIKE